MELRSASARGVCLLLSLTFSVGLGQAQPAPASTAGLLLFSKVTSVEPLANGIELRNGALVMRIIALQPNILRIRASRTGILP